MPDNRTCPLTADIYRKPDVIDCFYICDRAGLRVTAFPDGMRIQGGDEYVRIPWPILKGLAAAFSEAP